MATSKHFLEQVQTGDVAAALRAALENAGSLQIVTHVAGAGAASDLPDSQKICTSIDAVAGTIETSVGETFVQDENFKVLCEGHMQQVVAGCSSVRDNLDTIQALLDWVSDEQPGAIANTAEPSSNVAGSEGMGEAAVVDDAELGEIADDASGFAATAALGAAAAGVGLAAGSAAPEGDMLDDLLEQPAEDSVEASELGTEGALGESNGFDEAIGLDGLGDLESSGTDEGDLLDDLSSESGMAEGELDLGAELSLDGDSALGTDDSLSDGGLEGDLSFGDELNLGDGADLSDDSLGDSSLDLGLDAPAAAPQDDDLGFDLGESPAEAEDAGPETEFLVVDAEDDTQLFGAEAESAEAASSDTLDFADLGGEPVEDFGGDLSGDLGTELGTNLEELGLGGDDLGTGDVGEIDLGSADLDVGSLDSTDLDSADLGTPDTDAALADAGSDDPLAGLELGSDLGEAASDDPFNLENIDLGSADLGSADSENVGLESGGIEAGELENSLDSNNLDAEAPLNLEEDTLAGVSWAESGRGDGDLDLGGLDLGDAAAPSNDVADPEVDDLALDAIGDFDSGMWDEASAETIDGAQDDSPAKVTRSLESLFSADDSGTPGTESESGSGDPLSALFSDTSLDDIPSDSAAGGDSQETLAANPFEIDDLENDPFADLMLDESNG